MRLLFAGTPEFAAVALRALHAAGHEIALVLTQPDRRAGRGLKSAPSPVKQLALELGLTVQQPPTLKSADVLATLTAESPDVMVVAAYGLILPREVLAIPRLYCLNIHASLLPRWRGAAPIQRAILAGDSETGISVMQMDEGLDTGPVMLRSALPITPQDTAGTLHDRLAALGASLILEALASPPPAQPQDAARATYAAKIDKREARIAWQESAAITARVVRAFNPAPGANTTLRGQPLKIWAATELEGTGGEPGTVRAVDANGIVVACGAGALRLTELQRAGGKRVCAAAFLAGCPVESGERLGIG
jgi:methionyl-tRNA formyltransferase